MRTKFYRRISFSSFGQPDKVDFANSITCYAIARDGSVSLEDAESQMRAWNRSFCNKKHYFIDPEDIEA